jgi:hypothetical protein
MFSVTPLCRSYASAGVHPSDRVLLTDPGGVVAGTRLLLERLTGGPASFIEPDDAGADRWRRGGTRGAHLPVDPYTRTRLADPLQTVYEVRPEIDSVIFPATSCLPARSAELTCQAETRPTC